MTDIGGRLAQRLRRRQRSAATRNRNANRERDFLHLIIASFVLVLVIAGIWRFLS